MARVDNLSNFLTDVADAIRDKKGTSAAIAASSFDTEIAAIVTSDDVKLQEKTVSPTTSKQTVVADSSYDALSKVTVNAITLQEKTVTPSTSSQTITPDSSYNGLSKVTVNSMPTITQATPSITVSDAGLITASSTQSAGYVAAGTKSATKQLTTKAAETITPGTSNKTAVAKGVYTTGAVTIKGDSNLVASNIRSGKSIFGVSGTLVEGITPSGELSITENGTYDVTNYASTNVNVSSVQDTSIEDAMVTRTLSGDYENNRVTTIGTEALRATQITGLHCEEVTTVGGEALRDCKKLVSIYLPKCKTLQGYSVGICPLLERVELNSIETIQAYSFYSCPKLTTFIIRTTSKVCSLANVNAFNSSGISSGTGFIYVPDTLVDSYKTATNWSTYANQIKPLSQLS